MKGFLGRVASRAVGEATAARPRLADPFGSREAVAPVGLDVLDLEAAAPASGPTPRVDAAAPTVGASPAERTAGPRESEAPPVLRRAQELVRPSPRTPAKAAAASRRENERHGIDPRPELRASEPPPPAAQVETEPVVAAPLARAASLVPAPAARAVTGMPVAAEEQPVVRVHIGRLEVRANLEQPQPQPQPRQHSRRQELTLSDYLRGRQAR